MTAITGKVPLGRHIRHRRQALRLVGRDLFQPYQCGATVIEYRVEPPAGTQGREIPRKIRSSGNPATAQPSIMKK